MIDTGPATQGDYCLGQWRLWVTFSESCNRIFINADIKIPWSCLYVCSLEEAVIGLNIRFVNASTLSAEQDYVQS